MIAISILIHAIVIIDVDRPIQAGCTSESLYDKSVDESANLWVSTCDGLTNKLIYWNSWELFFFWRKILQNKHVDSWFFIEKFYQYFVKGWPEENHTMETYSQLCLSRIFWDWRNSFDFNRENSTYEGLKTIEYKEKRTWIDLRLS